METFIQNRCKHFISPFVMKTSLSCSRKKHKVNAITQNLPVYWAIARDCFLHCLRLRATFASWIFISKFFILFSVSLAGQKNLKHSSMNVHCITIVLYVLCYNNEHVLVKKQSLQNRKRSGLLCRQTMHVIRPWKRSTQLYRIGKYLPESDSKRDQSRNFIQKSCGRS